MSEPEDWLRVGANVAVVRNDRHVKSVQMATVDRIGKRDVVLDDGQRFNVRTRNRHDGGAWGWTTALMDPADPLVARLQDEIAHDRTVRAARDACRAFLDRTPNVTAFDVVVALAPLTGVADEIRALATPTPTTAGDPNDQ